MRGIGIHSSAGGPCIGMTSLGPCKSGNKGGKRDTSSKKGLYTHMYLSMVKVTEKDDNSAVFSPTQRKMDRKLKHAIEIPNKVSSSFGETQELHLLVWNNEYTPNKLCHKHSGVLVTTHNGMQYAISYHRILGI